MDGVSINIFSLNIKNVWLKYIGLSILMISIYVSMYSRFYVDSYQTGFHTGRGSHRKTQYEGGEYKDLELY